MTATCRNADRRKYFCQNAHAAGACANETVRSQCLASCSCADDRRSNTPGRYADNACLPRFAPSREGSSSGTLVVVNSHCGSPFVAPLLRDLKRLPLFSLTVFGGCPQNSGLHVEKKTSRSATLRVAHDSIDFTAMIALLDHLADVVEWTRPFDRVFYIHDSVRVEPVRLAHSLRRFDSARTCGLTMGQSMNIGIYSLRDLFNAKRFLQTVHGHDNASKEQRMWLKLRNVRGLEGAVLDRAGAWAKYDTCGCQLTAGPTSKRRFNFTTSDGRVLQRVALDFSEFGIVKYQTVGRHVVY